MNFIFLTLSIAVADPQDIPDEKKDPPEEKKEGESTKDDGSPAENEDNSIPEKETDQPSSDSDETLSTTKKEETPPILKPKNSAQIKEESVSEIGKLSKELSDFTANEDKEDFDISYLQGYILYSFDFHYWNVQEQMEYIPSYSLSGNPQYMWTMTENGGPLIGLRFRKREINQLEHQIKDNLIGVITGFQMGPIGLNTAGSYYTHLLFIQEEKSKSSSEITYQYFELSESRGVLWEQSLNYNNLDKDFFIEGKIGFPFQLEGSREMGEPFIDSWRASINISFSRWLIGYEYNVFPNSEEHVVILGSGLHL